ncbi:MAG TPA: signal peptidase II [Candidatus Faecisoma merdavium]|nr:signal peptidase II [Candidatus Faecisoma merdavium]
MYKKLIIFGIIFLLIDQLSKGLISLYIPLNESIKLTNFLSITYVHNIGAAFSILQGARWLFIILGIIALNIIYIFFIKDKKLTNFEIIIYALMLSGIIGNIIDRLLYGYVIDFIDITLFNFAIFNFADSFIVISVILLVVFKWKNI